MYIKILFELSLYLLECDVFSSSEIIQALNSELDDTRQLLLTCQKDLEDAKSDSAQKAKRVEELHGK